MVPGWVGWSQQQLLMNCMQEGAEAEHLGPEPVWEAGRCAGGKQGGCWTPSSEEWAWESVFIMNQLPHSQVILGRPAQIPTLEAEFYVYKKHSLRLLLPSKGSEYKGLNIENTRVVSLTATLSHEGRKGKTPSRVPSLSKHVGALSREPFLPQRPLPLLLCDSEDLEIFEVPAA